VPVANVTVLHTSQVLVFKCDRYALRVTAKFEHTIPGLVFHRMLFSVAMPVVNRHFL
jgi:hypothetical protein